VTSWPKDFVWGVSTSAYQIEGAANADGRGPSIWDVRCHQPGRIDNGDTGDVACDHYHRYREDVALMKQIGVDAYRFSVAWPRVLPQGRGAANERGLAFYDQLIDELLRAGIEPWLCLYHWDLPQALHEQGGWASRDSVGWFADYAGLIARRYGDRVKRFATFNEFSVFTLFGYVMDWGAPGVKDKAAHLQAIHHVNLAHGAAVDVLRAQVPGASIGAIHNRQPVLPENDTAADRAAAVTLDELWNNVFPDPQILGRYGPRIAEEMEPYLQPGDMARICRPTDWLGINHYNTIYARADASSPWGFAWGEAPADVPRTGIDWPIAPSAFRDTLIGSWQRYRLPIYVTENGFGSHEVPCCFDEVDDQHRIAYLKRYVAAMAEAMVAGADVRGYFIWSLLDNFEWGAGFANRFGIVHVDFKSLKRTPKASSRWYREHIAKAKLTPARPAPSPGRPA
jgi:beta-glucosidase